MKQILLAAFTALSFTACNTPATTSTTASDSTTNNMSTGNAPNSEEAKEERNKQTALASINAINGNDTNIDAIFKDVDKDAIDYGEGSMAPVKGLDSTKAGAKMWMEAMKDYKGTDIMAVADGDYVMVYGTWSGTWKGDLMGMKPTGKSFKVKDVDIFKFNDAGKIIEHRAIQSMNEIARQTGMKMPNH